MRTLRTRAWVILLVTVTPATLCGAAQTTKEKMEAIDFIISRAKSFCEVVKQTSSSDAWNASLQVKGEVAALVKQVASLSGDGAIAIEKRKSEGALQKDLGTLLSKEVLADESKCRQNFESEMRKQLLEAPPTSRVSAIDVATKYEAAVGAEGDRLMQHLRHTTKAQEATCVAFRSKWDAYGAVRPRVMQNGMVSAVVAPFQAQWPDKPSLNSIVGEDPAVLELSRRRIEGAASQASLYQSFASEGRDLGCIAGYEGGASGKRSAR